MTTIKQIQEAVVLYFDLTMKDMPSHCKVRRLVRPRQVAMYLARQLTRQSLPAIGREFGRDHTTVIHAVAVIGEMIARNDKFSEDVACVRRSLEG